MCEIRHTHCCERRRQRWLRRTGIDPKTRRGIRRTRNRPSSRRQPTAGSIALRLTTSQRQSWVVLSRCWSTVVEWAWWRSITSQSIDTVMSWSLLMSKRLRLRAEICFGFADWYIKTTSQTPNNKLWWYDSSTNVIREYGRHDPIFFGDEVCNSIWFDLFVCLMCFATI